MSPQRQTVEIAGHQLRVTSLDKVLYPASGTTKAEVLEYLQTVADVMIPHMVGRPVTRKRWPDGVGTEDSPREAFFRKNLEDSAPEWVPRLALQHSDHVNVYPVVTSPAELAWFGQVAALELHVPQWRFDADPVTTESEGLSPAPRSHPDRLVLDLDPGEGVGLLECAQVADWCRQVLEGMGLASVPVTSGSKGIHLYAALDGSSDSQEVSSVAKELAQALEKDHPDEVVSAMKKSRRAGKVFIDWSQNHWNKTTVAPYSLRGRPGSAQGPWVAAPRSWDELTDPELDHLDFRAVMQRVTEGIDPMQDITGASAAETSSGDRLATYRSKRDAAKTSEPVPEDTPQATDGDPIFVIQEHHVSRLHYDTRIEHDGVLVSWAVPKGPPLRRGTQRLAVQTEDHPVEYAQFEGTIPAGEYGAGEVSIWDSGTVDIEKWEPGKVVAVFHGRADGGLGGVPRRYALVHTQQGAPDDAQDWLIRMTKDQPVARRKAPSSSTPSAHTTHDHRGPAGSAEDEAQVPDPLPTPMLATLLEAEDLHRQDFDRGWVFEGKWDGYRMIAAVTGGQQSTAKVRLLSRNGKDYTAVFPELSELTEAVPPGTVLDGEVVALNTAGRPDFGRLQQRGRLTGRKQVERAVARIPVHYMVFDVLHTAEHSDVTGWAYCQRRELLSDLLTGTAHIQLPEDLGDLFGEAMEVSQELDLEGILAKRATSVYRPGQRSQEWVKIKHANHADVVIIGYRKGKGSRSATFGSLLLATEDDAGQLCYAGRVGTGFSEADITELHRHLRKLTRKTPPISDVPDPDTADVTWVRPTLLAEVKHAGFTAGNRLRHPVWRRLR
ncbi:ATP-dependent DNA ligase [Nesterenkonia alba]|uniref:ATP-dependent DNA ligase n=1 Tax=Nesterenkonia alba TaxID=515814 RepID=UPI0003B793F6|nr:ATP-dependent DNA ligase [Nesterenkonia alba]